MPSHNEFPKQSIFSSLRAAEEAPAPRPAPAAAPAPEPSTNAELELLRKRLAELEASLSTGDGAKSDERIAALEKRLQDTQQQAITAMLRYNEREEAQKAAQIELESTLRKISSQRQDEENARQLKEQLAAQRRRIDELEGKLLREAENAGGGARLRQEAEAERAELAAKMERLAAETAAANQLGERLRLTMEQASVPALRRDLDVLRVELQAGLTALRADDRLNAQRAAELEKALAETAAREIAAAGHAESLAAREREARAIEIESARKASEAALRAELQKALHAADLSGADARREDAQARLLSLESALRSSLPGLQRDVRAAVDEARAARELAQRAESSARKESERWGNEAREAIDSAARAAAADVDERLRAAALQAALAAAAGVERRIPEMIEAAVKPLQEDYAALSESVRGESAQIGRAAVAQALAEELEARLPQALSRHLESHLLAVRDVSQSALSSALSSSEALGARIESVAEGFAREVAALRSSAANPPFAAAVIERLAAIERSVARREEALRAEITGVFEQARACLLAAVDQKIIAGLEQDKAQAQDDQAARRHEQSALAEDIQRLRKETAANLETFSQRFAAALAARLMEQQSWRGEIEAALSAIRTEVQSACQAASTAAEAGVAAASAAAEGSAQVRAALDARVAEVARSVSGLETEIRGMILGRLLKLEQGRDGSGK